MRLRWKLTLAFLFATLLPAGLVLSMGLRTLREGLASQLDARINTSVRIARAFDELRRESFVRGAQELSRSPGMEEFLESYELGESRALRTAGETLLREGSLDVLVVLDEQGRTLTSGHWPARLHEPDPALLDAAQHTPTGATTWREVPTPTRDGPKDQPTQLTAVSLRTASGKRLWLVAGRFVTPAWAESLAELTGGRAELHAKDRVLASAGTALPPVVERRLEPMHPGEGTTWVLAFSGAALKEASFRLTVSALVLAGLGCAAAFLLAWALARRITRPVEALTTASLAIARGELETRVELPAPSGELGQLVETFNRMGGDLRQATRKLVASERASAWQDVARGLAHELKNPLTPIRMSLETLLSAQGHPKFGELFSQSAPAMLEEVDRLRRTIDEFSQFARLPAPSLAQLDLGAWAEGVLAVHGALGPGIRLVKALEPGITVQADRDGLTQVLVNLVRNADEALGGKGTVRVSVKRQGDEARLEVADSGAGIPPALRERVLEPHFSTKGRGSGLGLAIAARICHEHGGTLEIGEAPEGGALVWATLPVNAVNKVVPPGAP